ncbi:dihydrouracil dehydrogenase (NAD(+)), partial [Sarracenia purpurea var. burkii]
MMGKHLHYSKFWTVNNNPGSKFKQVKLSSRTGMIVIYVPTFLAGVASFALFPNDGLRLQLLRLAIIVHLLKRTLE